MNSTSDAPNDVDLMEAVAAGDHAALETLYRRHSELALAICIRILGNACDAEEVLIDIFWELWEKSDRYNPLRASPRTYIVQLARSRAIDHLRSSASGSRARKQASQLGSGDTLQEVAGSRREPVDQMVSDEQWRVVTQALETLDRHQREVLQLAYFDGLSHSQIAQSLCIPLGTVKTRLRQGLIKLRETVRSLYSDEGPL